MWLRALPVLVWVGLAVFGAVDCLLTPADDVRGPGRGSWVALCLLVPYLGPLAWLMTGRPPRARHGRVGGPDGGGYGWTAEGAAGFRPDPRGPIGPDDDPDFITSLSRFTQERRDDE